MCMAVICYLIIVFSIVFPADQGRKQDNMPEISPEYHTIREYGYPGEDNLHVFPIYGTD